jgi:hypothetical protein
MFQMAGVFAEFERSMNQERAREQGKVLGRPKVPPRKEALIRQKWGEGMDILKITQEVGVGTSVVQRVLKDAEPPMATESSEAPRTCRYRYNIAFKRAVVEQTMTPEASVACPQITERRTALGVPAHCDLILSVATIGDVHPQTPFSNFLYTCGIRCRTFPSCYRTVFR